MISDMLNICTSLSATSRYSNTHLNKPETVLEHIGFVCTTAFIVGSKIDGVDIEQLLIKATCHDLEESATGDIINPVKHANPELEEAIEALGLEAVINMSNILGIPHLPTYWSRAKSDDIEGRIIQFVDVLAVLGKIHDEVMLYGNRSIKKYALNTYAFFIKLLREEKNEQFKDMILEACDINMTLLGDKNENT